jgi:hypothetical protein
VLLKPPLKQFAISKFNLFKLLQFKNMREGDIERNKREGERKREIRERETERER